MMPKLKTRFALLMAVVAALTLAPSTLAQTSAPELSADQQVLFEKLNNVARSTHRRVTAESSEKGVTFSLNYGMARIHKTGKIAQDSFGFVLPKGKVKVTYTVGKSKKTHSLTVTENRNAKLKAPALKADATFALTLELNGKSVPLKMKETYAPAAMSAEEALKRYVAAQYDGIKAQFPLSFGLQATSQSAQKPIDEVIIRYIPASEWNLEYTIDAKTGKNQAAADAPQGVWAISLYANLNKKKTSWYAADGYLLIHNGESAIKSGYALLE